MLSPINPDNGRCARWCALVVLVALLSLTIRVATRYGSPATSGVSTARILHKQTTQEPGLQRLSKTAMDWMPPAVQVAVWHCPSTAPSVAPSRPAIPKIFLETSLYNRPPPSV